MTETESFKAEVINESNERSNEDSIEVINQSPRYGNVKAVHEEVKARSKELIHKRTMLRHLKRLCENEQYKDAARCSTTDTCRQHECCSTRQNSASRHIIRWNTT